MSLEVFYGDLVVVDFFAFLAGTVGVLVYGRVGQVGVEATQRRSIISLS